MSSLQERDDIKKQLSTLSCPFTWQLEEAANNYMTVQKVKRKIEDDNIGEEVLSCLEKLILCLVILYEKVLFNEITDANVKLDECDKLVMEMKDMREDEDIMRVIEHIFNSTKCHFFFETNNVEKLKIILPTIIKTSDFTIIELAALAGCQSVAWSVYVDFGREKAMNLAKQAIKDNSDKALWHYILAKSARRDRRTSCYNSTPSEIEKVHFKLAYEKLQNPVFGIYLAQMYHERSWTVSFEGRKEQYELLMNLYKEILDLSDNNYRILLMSALGFLRIRSSEALELAKSCLDAVEKIRPNSSMYFHYKGRYLEQLGNVTEALEFYKKGGELYNYASDINYVTCGGKAQLIDPVTHLQSMLVKYDKAPSGQIQYMHLCIATCYFQKNDVKSALEYYLKAIEIDPKSKQLKYPFIFLNFIMNDGIVHHVVGDREGGNQAFNAATRSTIIVANVIFAGICVISKLILQIYLYVTKVNKQEALKQMHKRDKQKPVGNILESYKDLKFTRPEILSGLLTNINNDQNYKPNNKSNECVCQLLELSLLFLIMPKEFPYTVAVQLNNCYSGLYHSFIRHIYDWAEVIPSDNRVIDRLSPLMTEILLVASANNKYNVPEALNKFVEARKRLSRGIYNDVQIALVRIQMSMHRFLQKNITFDNYLGRSTNTNGLERPYYKVKTKTGIKVMILGLSDRRFKPSREDKRPIRQLITVFFESWEGFKSHGMLETKREMQKKTR